MELDDLRRQWRQPEPAALPTLTAPQLDALLKGRTLGLVEKMRRNAWLEVSCSALIGVVLLLAMTYMHDGLYWLYAGLTVVLAFITVGYYYRVLGTLRRMTEPTGSVRQHLAMLTQGLRHLLRFYYRLTLATSPVILVLGYGYLVVGEWQRPGGVRVGQLVGLGVAMLLFGGFAQLSIAHVTRQYMQRLYGQHLDRLEGQLRELREGEPAA